MKLSEALKLARQLLNEYGLENVEVKLDNAKRRHGQCRHLQKQMSLSRYFINLNEEPQIRNTVLHEIAHFLVGPGHGHDRTWKRKALEVGCDGNRCSGDDIQSIKGRYKGVCPACKTEYFKHRKGKHVLDGVYTCRCKGRGKIKFVDTYARITA